MHTRPCSDAHYAGIRSISPRQRNLIANMHQYSAPYASVPPPGSRNYQTDGIWGEWSAGRSLLTRDDSADLPATMGSGVTSAGEDIEEW